MHQCELMKTVRSRDGPAGGDVTTVESDLVTVAMPVCVCVCMCVIHVVGT